MFSILSEAVSGLVLCLGHKDVLQTVLYLTQKPLGCFPALLCLFLLLVPLYYILTGLRLLETSTAIKKTKKERIIQKSYCFVSSWHGIFEGAVLRQ